MNKAYIALGSNLNRPMKQVLQAINSLNEHVDIDLITVSSFYKSSALRLDNSEPQNSYINAVASLQTGLTAHELLKQLQFIELQQGRVRKKKWAARTLDLDILLYNDEVIKTDKLTVPHPEMYLRNFVLFPLAEISPNIYIPEQEQLSDLLKSLDKKGLEKIDGIVSTNK